MATDQQHTSRVAADAPKNKPFSVLGWVLAAMSLLNLVHDLTWVELSKKLADWVDAYAFLVHRLGSFLFGWIHFKWIGVSAEEHHVLVLASILLAALYRGELHHQREQYGRVVDRVGPAVTFFFLILFPLIPALLLPGYWGLGGSILMLILLPLIVMGKGTKPEDNFADPAVVKRELVGVGGVFVLVMALNYALLRA
jgi:hypothetical protein